MASDLIPTRHCFRCGQSFSGDDVKREVGWTPTRSGWRCAACSRAHLHRVDALARTLVENHRRHGWAGTAEHTPYDECVFCEALAAATELLLRRATQA
jgi:hypothetical protein